MDLATTHEKSVQRFVRRSRHTVCRIDIIGRSERHSAMCIQLRVETGEKTRGLAAQHGEQTTSDVEDIEIHGKTFLIHSLERLKFDNLRIINMT